MLEEENIKPLVRRMKAWLMNGKKLYFTDDDVYRKIKHVVVGDIVNEIEEHGEFEVDFKLDPFEYTEDANIMLSTPDLFIIRYNGIGSNVVCCRNGTFRIFINDVSFQIKDVKGSVVIDSELLEAYSGTVSMNDKMIGDFPEFQIGLNKIEWSGAIQFISIQPRWRYK